MASNLANLLFSAVSSVKPAQTAPAKPVQEDKDRFAQLLDAPATTPKRSDNAATQTTAEPAADQQQAAGGNAPTKTETAAVTTEAKAPEATDATATEDGGELSLADALLAALAALGLAPEAVGEDGAIEEVLIDPTTLEDIEGALQDLSALLGIDINTLMQQLTELAKGVAAEGAGGATPDLMSKLNAWLGEQLGAGVTIPPAAEASLAKLMEGLGTLAETLPTEPELATPQLKLTEPVLAGKTAAAATAVAPVVEAVAKPEAEKVEATAEVKSTEESDDSQRSVSGAKAEPVEAARPNGNQHQAARANGSQDNVLNLSATTPGQAEAATPKAEVSAAPRVMQTGYQTSQQQLNLPQIAFEVSRQVTDGNSRFQIRLDPPELGRIDVKLDIDSNGQVHAKLTVEKAETLDLMQRDQRALERALQQAGLDQSKTNLEFSLKQNPFAGDQNQGSGSDQHGGNGGQDGGEEADTPVPAVTLYRGNLSASGLNILA